MPCCCLCVADCAEGADSANGSQSCRLEDRLDRYQGTDDFSTKFVHLANDTVQENEFTLSNASVSMVPFTVQRTTDIGGTLAVKVAFKKKDVVRLALIWLHCRLCEMLCGSGILF